MGQNFLKWGVFQLKNLYNQPIYSDNDPCDLESLGKPWDTKHENIMQIIGYI